MKNLIFLLFVMGIAVVCPSKAQDAVGKLFWRGMVDDRVQLIVRGDQVKTNVVSGATMPEGIYSFTSPLPNDPVNVDLIKRKGRSKRVSVIQQPAESNNYTAIIEIYDQGGGAKEYQLEIFWH